MAAVAQPIEQVSDVLQNLNVDSKCESCVTTASEDMYDVAMPIQIPPGQDGNSSDGSADAAASGGTGDALSTNDALEGVVEHGLYFTPNGFAPHGYVYEYPHGGVAGFEGPLTGEWVDYAQYIGVDGLEIPAQGIYSDNGQMLYHHQGYGYTSQPAYGHFNPSGSAIPPSMGADGQLYGPQAFQYQGHLYQPPLSSGGQYISTQSALSSEVPTTGAGEPGPPGVETRNGAAANGSGVSMGMRPGYPLALIPPHGPYARGVLPVTIQHPQDQRSYEGLRTAAPSWADVTKITEGQQIPGVSAMHVVSQPSSASGIPSQSLRPITPLRLHISSAAPQRSHAISPTLGPGTVARGFPPLGRVMPSRNGSGRGARVLQGSGMDSRSGGRGWIGVDKGKQRGRGAGTLVNGNGNLDILNEQNRGPRTTRLRTQLTMLGVARHSRGQSVISNGSNEALSTLTNWEQYNQPDFQTKYDEAKFFVIKSYSEDDVHKSIKYNVWASTPNGNKRLDVAYQDAKSRSVLCPVFFFFSVNASGQFCGVAEMMGPVDFNKSVDFWQQDKWNGRFAVKWHIIKDIPNCQFRHIILENNDNKPVTNSRDTQEVKFEQGLEMLSIFKNHTSKTSILDDFQFYESRQRAMQEKRARQQVQQHRDLQRFQGGGRPGNESEQAHRTDISVPRLKIDKDVEMEGECPKASQTINCDPHYSNGLVENDISEPTSQSKSLLMKLSSMNLEDATAASDSKKGDICGPQEDEDNVENGANVVDKIVKKEFGNPSM